MGQYVRQRLCAQYGQFIEKRSRRFLRVQLYFRFLQDGPRIHAFVEEHDRHTAYGLAVLDGILDRRGSPILRKKRAMHVQAAVLRNIQYGLGQNLAVGNDDDDIGLKCRQFGYDLFVPQRIRLQHGNPQFQSLFLYGRKGHLFPSAPLLIGLAVHCSDIEALIVQRLQGRHGKIGRPHKYDS